MGGGGGGEGGDASDNQWGSIYMSEGEMQTRRTVNLVCTSIHKASNYEQLRFVHSFLLFSKLQGTEAGYIGEAGSQNSAPVGQGGATQWYPLTSHLQ